MNAADLLMSGKCSAPCLLGLSSVQVCSCRCDGKYHGALSDADVRIPTDEALALSLGAEGVMTFDLPEERATFGRISLIRDLLGMTPGMTPVIIRLIRKDHAMNLLLDRRLWVTASDALTEAIDEVIDMEDA
jgi:hypothetical protein